MADEKDQGKQTSLPEQFIRDASGNITGAKITVQGQEKEIPLNELLELAQKGDDYTKKTQELSDKEKKIQEQIQRQAEELALQYIDQLEETKQTKAQDDGTLDPQEIRMRKLEEKIDKLTKGSEEQEVAQLELTFETQLKELSNSNPITDVKNVDERKVWERIRNERTLSLLSTNPKLDMGEVFKTIDKELSERRDAIRKYYKEDKEIQPKAEGGGPKTLPITTEKPLTAADLYSGKVRRVATEHFQQEQGG